MRVFRTLAWAGATFALGAGVAACFDLFHSTSGIEPGCVLDAAACHDADGSPSDAEADDGGGDASAFCAWTPLEARQNAAHACAWLGACESPLGGNAFGACMFSALLAYDCTDNPSYPVRGAAFAYWDCLWQTQTCADVDRCVYPSGKPVCPNPGDYTGCAGPLRIECTDGGVPLGESCVAAGQTCGTAGGMGDCTGSADGGLGCAAPECVDGTELHWCAGASDVGRSCASIGAGACGGFPSAPAKWVACVPQGDAACGATTSATCASGTATSCAAGVAVTLNCEALLQAPDASNCTTGTLDPPFDWTSSCAVTPPACKADACDAGTITGCARGAPFHADCTSLGLGACRMVATDVGAEKHAACSAP